MFRNWGLKKQFVTVFLVLITLPTLLFGILIYYQTTKVFKQQAENNAIGRLEKNEENLTSIINVVQHMSSFMIYDQNFRTFFTSSQQDSYQSDFKSAEEGMVGYLSFQLMSDQYIDSILLKGKNGAKLEFGNKVMGSEKHWDQKAIEKEGAPTWSNTYTVDDSSGGMKKIITLTRVINDINHINRPIGLVKIRLDEEELFKTIENAPAQQEGSFFVLTKNGDVVLHHDKSLTGKRYPDKKVIEWVANGQSSTLKYKKNNISYLVVKKKIANTNWVSISMVNENMVVKNLYNVRNMFGLMVVSLLLFGTIAFLGFYNTFIKKIIELTNQTRQLQKGDFTAEVNVTSKDEIGQLGLRFNHMVRTIQDYINREYKLTINQKESELKALQSQIDPHFLYNTLDMIRWTARLENAMETGQLIERLSKIFRMNLNMGKIWVKLEEEINYIQNYLELQKSRMGRRLDYHIFYDDQIKDIQIIKQILQPLVENSILHGFQNLPRQGIITIRCYQVEMEIWVDVIDNGWGFSKSENTKETEKPSGYALTNLKERLQFAYGEKATIEQLNTTIGAWIRLRFPR